MVLKMNVIDCIKKRRSVRNFIDKDVGMDLLGQILEAGTFAPSSGNLQNWFFILVTDQALKDQLAASCLNQNWLAKAPILIIVVADPNKVEREYNERGKKIYSIQNASAAIQNMLLAATELGLGSCWVSAFDELIRFRYVRNGKVLTVPLNSFPAAVGNVAEQHGLGEWPGIFKRA